MPVLPVLHSWLASRQGQLPSNPTGLAPGLGRPTASSKRSALTGSTERRNTMIITILFRLSVVQDPGQELANGDRIRIFRPEYFLTDAERPLTKRLCLCIMTLYKSEFSQVVEPFSGSGMLRSQRFLNDSKGSLPKGLGSLMVS